MSAQDVLPQDLMSLQLGQVDLLMAMYRPDDAIVMDDASIAITEALRSWCEGDAGVSLETLPSGLNMSLKLEAAANDTPPTLMPLKLNLSVPLRHQGNAKLDVPPIKARLQQPSWMSKAQVAELNSAIPDEDIISVIEFVREAASQYACSQAQAEETSVSVVTAPLIRVWFYFPSISTRSKRDDLVHNAPAYGLTGFLLAGKPGILCLEGGSTAIDDYMRFIKTESWGDIPPQHKKVSERYRETGDAVMRAFSDMQEITDSVGGERRGERANRGDMKAVEAWLTKYGLGEAFAKILM